MVLGTAVVASDSLFLVCGLFIGSYLKTLQKRLENLKASDGSSKINEIVEDHNQILKIFEDFNKAFAPIWMVKCLIVAILFCVLGFQLLVVSFLFFSLIHEASANNFILQSDDLPKKITNVFLLIGAFIGLLIFCVIGTWIQNEVTFEVSRSID